MRIYLSNGWVYAYNSIFDQYFSYWAINVISIYYEAVGVIQLKLNKILIVPLNAFCIIPSCYSCPNWKIHNLRIVQIWLAKF